MGYISSKQLSGNEGLTGVARQKDIDRRRILELEEQIKREKAKKKSGGKSRVAVSSTDGNSGENPKKNKKSVGKRSSHKSAKKA